MLSATWEKITVLAGVVLSVGGFLFLLSRFAFAKIFSNTSRKRIGLLSLLATVIVTPPILYLIAYLIFTPRFPDLKDNLEGWAIKITYQIHLSKTISVVDRRFRIKPGKNNVLIVSRAVCPVVKPGQTEPRDLRSVRNLVIELSQTDTIVSPINLGSSKMLREILAFSPNYGTKPLDKDEKIEAKRTGKDRWEIDSHLVDFQFKAEFSFRDSSKVTTRYVDKWTK